MKDFFMKHAHSFEPIDAIEVLCSKLYKIKELVKKGQNPMQDLKELSDMIDDYAQYSGGHSFSPKDYYNPGQGQSDNQYSPEGAAPIYPYGPTAHIGYRPSIYPYYFPPFNQGGNQGQPGQGGQGGNQGGR